jgi:hypothetical protein
MEENRIPKRVFGIWNQQDQEIDDKISVGGWKNSWWRRVAGKSM